MKRFLVSSLLILAGLALVIVSALSVGSSQSLALEGQDQERIVELETQEATASPDLVESDLREGVDYYLPYPGLLPDHPLYFLKMMRDRVRMLVAGASQKGELSLLYADKRIGAAEALVHGGKQALGAEVAYKAEGYLRSALEAADEMENPAVWRERVARAALKHRQILAGLVEGLEGEELTVIEQAEEINGQILGGLGEVVESIEEIEIEESVEELETVM